MTEALVLAAAKSCIARCGAAQWSVTEWIKRAKCVLEIPWNWIIPLFPLFLMSEFLLSLHEYSDLAIHVGVSYKILKYFATTSFHQAMHKHLIFEEYFLIQNTY